MPGQGSRGPEKREDLPKVACGRAVYDRGSQPLSSPQRQEVPGAAQPLPFIGLAIGCGDGRETRVKHPTPAASEFRLECWLPHRHRLKLNAHHYENGEAEN